MSAMRSCAWSLKSWPLLSGRNGATMARIHPEAELAAILVEETRKPAHQCAKAAAELAALARQLTRLYEHAPIGESPSDQETRGRVTRLEGKDRAIVDELVGLPPDRAPIT